MKNLSRERILNFIWIFLFSVFIAWIYLVFFLKDPESNTNQKATFPKLIEGTAHKPYVYRRLVPDLSKILDLSTPSFIYKPLNKNLHKFFEPAFYGENKKDWIVAYFYANVIALLSLILSFVYFSKMAKICEIENKWYYFLFFFGIPPFVMNYKYIYDFTTLFLFTSCFYYILKKEYFKFLPLFVLSCYNKETSLFIILFFLLLENFKLKKEKHIFLIQIITYLAIKIFLTLKFKNNPGTNLVFYPELHAAIIFDPYYFETIISYTIIFFFVYGKWSSKPEWLQKGLLLAPIYLILYLLFGFPGEYRVFFDIYSLLVLSSILTIKKIF